MTPFEQWQLDRYKNIIPDSFGLPEEQIYEAFIEEQERLHDYMNDQAELELLNHE